MYSSILYLFSTGRGKFLNYKSSFYIERFYSTDSLIVPRNYASKDKFFEWFTGLTDGEGLLLISIVNKGRDKNSIGVILQDGDGNQYNPSLEIRSIKTNLFYWWIF